MGGPNFHSEREAALAAGTQRMRRPSILESDRPPSEMLAAQLAAEPMYPGGPPAMRGRARTNSSLMNGSAQLDGEMAEIQNARALEVLDRVNQKLTGRDFKPTEELEVVQQVNKLIMEATKLENLCQHYIGWCSFW
jgi:serine/threonine-protein kinase mTOR